MLNAMEIQLGEHYTNENGVEFMITRNSLGTAYVVFDRSKRSENPLADIHFCDYFYDAVKYAETLAA